MNIEELILNLKECEPVTLRLDNKLILKADIHNIDNELQQFKVKGDTLSEVILKSDRRFRFEETGIEFKIQYTINRLKIKFLYEFNKDIIFIRLKGEDKPIDLCNYIPLLKSMYTMNNIDESPFFDELGDYSLDIIVNNQTAISLIFSRETDELDSIIVEW